MFKQLVSNCFPSILHDLRPQSSQVQFDCVSSLPSGHWGILSQYCSTGIHALKSPGHLLMIFFSPYDDDISSNMLLCKDLRCLWQLFEEYQILCVYQVSFIRAIWAIYHATWVDLTFKLLCRVQWTPQHFQLALKRLLLDFQNPHPN